jgi:hypothetical protein
MLYLSGLWCLLPYGWLHVCVLVAFSAPILASVPCADVHDLFCDHKAKDMTLSITNEEATHNSYSRSCFRAQMVGHRLRAHVITAFELVNVRQLTGSASYIT